MLLLHILWEIWKLKAWISRGIGYYTVFASHGPAIFWLSLQKIVKAPRHRWRSGKEHDTGAKGAVHNFWQNDIAQGHNINPLKSNGSKMADKSNSTKHWSSICKLNETPRSSMTVPKHCQKTKEWVVPQLLEWSSHSLAYEITQPIKTNHTLHGHSTCPLLWPTLWSMLLSESEQIYLLPIAVSLTEFFCNETSRAWASLGPKTRHCGFWLGSSPSWIWLSD